MSHGLTEVDTEAHPRRGRRILVAITALVVVAVAATVVVQLLPGAADADPVVGLAQIEVLDNRFEPPVVEVTVGTPVTWTFNGDAEHNVVGDGWGDVTPRTTGEFVHAFPQPGEYRFRCSLHFGMEGRVVVTE